MAQQFLYEMEQSVKVRDPHDEDANKVGKVISCGTDTTTDVPFYRVKFEDGHVRRFPQSELWPAR